MGFEPKDRQYSTVHGVKLEAGRRRTYYFDVKKSANGDHYITITESTKRTEDSVPERHRLFLYKEDFEKFSGTLQDILDIAQKAQRGEFVAPERPKYFEPKDEDS